VAEQCTKTLEILSLPLSHRRRITAKREIQVGRASHSSQVSLISAGIIIRALKNAYNIDAHFSGRNDILVGNQKISGRNNIPLSLSLPSVILKKKEISFFSRLNAVEITHPLTVSFVRIRF
jgi:hypothetical protein